MATMLGQPFRVRSVSMPSTPQPIALEIEEELKKLRTWVASTSSTAQMCNTLRDICNVHESIEIILHLPGNQQVLSQSLQKKWVEKELDQSIRVLDLCTTMRENLIAVKEHSQDLDLVLRRKHVVPQSKLQAYSRSWKRAQKEIKNCFKTLKQTENTHKSISTFDIDCDVSMTIRTLIEARGIIICLLLSIFSFLSKSKPELKNGKWSFISKTVLRPRKVACEDNLEYKHDVKSLEDLENGLDCVFKRLMLNRVSLLNIISL